MTSLRTMLTFGSLVLVGVSATSEASLDSAFDRFESAQAQSLVEDFWAHQRRLVQSRFVSSVGGQSAEDSLIKIEWYLRLGPARSPITLDDLKVVRDPGLLDEVLWSLLNEAVLGDVFLSSNDWEGIRASIGEFLRGHTLRRALLETDHAAWWAWIQDLPLKNTKTSWELKTLQQVLIARETSDPLASLQQYCSASREIPADQGAAGLTLARQLRASFPDSIVKQRQLLREVFTRKVPCQRLFKDLAEVYEERQNFDVASEQRSYSLLQKLESGKALNSAELRDVAHSLFEAGEWGKAFEFYSRARQEGSNDLDVRVREVVSGVRAEKVKFKDITETSRTFENVLHESFQSIYRDEVLRAYASFLESRKDLEPAVEVWKWNYQYATLKSQRIEGLEKSISLAAQWLDQGQMGLARKTEALDWLDSISTLRRLSPSSAVLKKQIPSAEARMKRLGLLGEADIRASLGEAQRGPR